MGIDASTRHDGKANGQRPEAEAVLNAMREADGNVNKATIPAFRRGLRDIGAATSRAMPESTRQLDY